MKYIKTIGQRTTSTKLVLVTVIEVNDLGEPTLIPDQFEMQSIVMDKSIYTGTYPTIKHNTDTIVDVGGDNKGMGISGFILNTRWYIKQGKNTFNDIFGLKI